MIVALAIVIAAHPKTTQYLADRYIKENGVDYSRIEGSFLSGITIYDIAYTNALKIKKLQISYTFLGLLNPTPTLKKIKADKLWVSPEDFPRDPNETAFYMFSFALSQLQLQQAQIHTANEELTLDLTAAAIRYTGSLDVKKLLLRADTSYGLVKIDGRVHKNRLSAQMLITPDTRLKEQYLASIQELPESFACTLDANEEKVSLQSRLEKISLNEKADTQLHDVDINLSYLYKEGSFDAEARYRIASNGFEAKVLQTALFTFEGDYTTRLNAHLVQQPFDLPFEKIEAVISGNADALKGHLKAGEIELQVQSKDYEKFAVQAHSKRLSLSFLSEAPETIRDEFLSFKSDALLHTAPFSLKGKVEVNTPFGTLKGDYRADSAGQVFKALVRPNREHALLSPFPLEKFSPVKIDYRTKEAKSTLGLDAKKLQLQIIKKGTQLHGFGNLGSGSLSATGKVSDGGVSALKVSARIPSVDAFVKEFELRDEKEAVFFDAQADINTTVDFSKDLILKSRLHLPWYLIRPDSQTLYKGEDLYLESTLEDKNLSIDRYSLNLMDHKVYSERPSTLSLDDKGNILFKEFWIYDKLLLTGTLNPSLMQGELRLKSDTFHYEGKEGNLTLKADINATLSSDGTQKIEGGLVLIDGIISYEPTKSYTISDDIIILQDIGPKKESKRLVNIHLTSLSPLSYKTRGIDIRLNPDILLWQDLNTSLALYGMVIIEEGEVKGSGKSFAFDKSEVYFRGATPLNPYLNLNLHHYTLDSIDIEIFVTNTLSAPIIIFSSKPAMSQNDIMSYLLFGEKASSVFETSPGQTASSAASSLLLATGLKQIFNETAGVNIDTLNILTNEEGTLGYEIGTRFSKDVRVVYKNDTISSVILQYSLSRSIRIDIDVHETGQGVSILYIKDF